MLRLYNPVGRRPRRGPEVQDGENVLNLKKENITEAKISKLFEI
jgi:hypothetical protein